MILRYQGREAVADQDHRAIGKSGCLSRPCLPIGGSVQATATFQTFRSQYPVELGSRR